MCDCKNPDQMLRPRRGSLPWIKTGTIEHCVRAVSGHLIACRRDRPESVPGLPGEKIAGSHPVQTGGMFAHPRASFLLPDEPEPRYGIACQALRKRW